MKKKRKEGVLGVLIFPKVKVENGKIYYHNPQIDYEFDCCICHRHIVGEWGNNPFPVVKAGECCDSCNLTVVMPARIKYFKQRTL